MFHLLQSFSYLFYDRFVVLIHIMLIFLRSEFQRIPQILDIAHLLQTLDKQSIWLIIRVFRAITLPPVDKFIQICINYDNRAFEPATVLLKFGQLRLDIRQESV